MLPTNRQPDKQTNQHHQKHNLIFQGGNKFGIVKYILCYEMRTNVYICIVKPI